ncbi:glutamate synthase large subunit [Longimicrobium terrae]|uniref:Glutamate synthase (NADPH/NADH) large chain n=1 Tax=Longimicrobium terrae TaxID=1639882 RepID=A0A841GU36_9BACT|nr:glutamate synthase large subunit [Longimicrobium terrae]MBB4634322.1 glutamate synthase (NADPH/NADH) large chain [Longimicrobium terrae]MBB6068788.1 glutamate synthase (NADPH/NADH) large chain [Longimicrobium terrae]
MHTSLYEPRFEHDACGVGFVARVSGHPGHDILRMALGALASLEHRGATSADGSSGDGAGVMTQIPRALLAREAAALGLSLDDTDEIALGMLFADADGLAERALETALAKQGLRAAAWRAVPVDPGALGERARTELPRIVQALVVVDGPDVADLERRLYLARKAFERSGAPGYVCSLSSRTVVYKALSAAHALADFYPDLADPLYQTAVAVYHQRYATNSLPSWNLAQPFRMLAHNGEINTLWSNRAWMDVRQAELPAELHPLLPADGSDSAALDAALELLARNGRGAAHSLSMLVTPAWEETGDELPPEVRAFFHAHAPLLEPWDGPAAVVFCDGGRVGAALDRNGLRPCRYHITDDGLVIAGSEAGAVPLDPHHVVEKGRLGPGQMLLVDVDAGRILRDDEIKHGLARDHAAPRWSAVPLAASEGAPPLGLDALSRMQRAFGITREDLQFILMPMWDAGAEAIWSMGDDTPVPPLSRVPRPVHAFLRQRFAQVTNPPIDPLREKRVMSLRTWLGPRPSLFDEAERTRLFELASPLLDRGTMAALRAQDLVRVAEIDCTFSVRDGLQTRVAALADEAERAVRGGAGLLVMTDRGVGAERPAVPLALAVGAAHHRLVRTGLRTRAGIVAEAGDCWDVHAVAVLIGCGATVVHPWMALECALATGVPGAEGRVIDALETGLRKVMSRMGISTVASYRGGQMFEALGLADEVVDACFRGMPSRIAGVGFGAFGADAAARAVAAFAEDEPDLGDPGRVRFRRGDDAEHHAWSPPAVRALQRASGSARGAGQGTPDRGAWEELQRLATDGAPRQLRDLLDFLPAGPEVPLDEVEPATEIVRRFVSSAMSLGALSPEAHQAITVGMNRLGARSNSGEGGEDPAWYRAGGGDRLDSRVKQVASGRFGVTTQYLARAEELEIKIAQGAKPGEGGQLPGQKVTELIARLRHAQPGVPLISPPPHHDIYSIEDLAQLIHDLKAVNPRAAVGVKLVAQAGVGTVAAGVAKAYAEYIAIAGHAGGTGASPISSIKYTGVPWELGLAEAQQVLVRNGLRGRVRLRVDGGLRTARDVVAAALLGAEEFGFGTAPLVAIGCDMARQCHRDSCPAGIATQSPELRERFRGTPEQVVAFFLHLAEDVRALLGRLGFRRLEDAVGRVDVVRQVRAPAGIDLSRMLAVPKGDELRCTQPRNPRPHARPALDERFTADALAAIRAGNPFRASYRIRNGDLTVGAGLAGALAGDLDLPVPPSIDLAFTGSAGQSFGAFAVHGTRLTLIGEANDYVGKGLCGGELVLRPDGLAARDPSRSVILGNVALYGATAGRLFAAGRAGERFAVRNSGALAVVEGVGDHGCEYMTGGTVVVLGRTGWNFAAGMTGGAAYVLDPRALFADRVNTGTVTLRRPSRAELDRLRAWVREHEELTGSRHAGALLNDWRMVSRTFWRVSPVAAGVPEAAVASADAGAFFR